MTSCEAAMPGEGCEPQRAEATCVISGMKSCVPSAHSVVNETGGYSQRRQRGSENTLSWTPGLVMR